MSFAAAEIIAELQARYPQWYDGTDPLIDLPKLKNCSAGVLAVLLSQHITSSGELSVSRRCESDSEATCAGKETRDEPLSLLPGEGDHVADAGKMIAPGEGSGWREIQSLANAIGALVDAVDCLSRDQSIGYQRTMHVRSSLERAGGFLRSALSPTQEGSTKGEGE